MHTTNFKRGAMNIAQFRKVHYRQLWYRKIKRWFGSLNYRRLKTKYSYWSQYRLENNPIESKAVINNRGTVTLNSTKENRKFIWASIIRDENYGNYLIESCLKNLLKIWPTENVIDVSSQRFPKPLTGYRFIINPGTTTLFQCPALDLAYQELEELQIPIVCFGASIWFRDYWKFKVDWDSMLYVARNTKYRIGSRDPFTHELLINNGIESELIGCPTLFCQGVPFPGDYIAFSFARDRLDEQLDYLQMLTKNYRVKVVIHEPQEQQWCKGICVEIVHDLDKMLDIYYQASCVITGRLHGALPGISAHKPVYYFQTYPEFDSRLTLLSYLGLPIMKLEELQGINYSEITYDLRKLNYLRYCFTDYIKQFKGKYLNEND